MENPSPENSEDASTTLPSRSASRRPSKLRAVALGLISGATIGVFALVALVAFSRREPLPQITLADVDAAADRWTKNGPANYDLELEQTGVNPGVVHVEVRNGQVTAMTLNGHSTRQHLWDDWSVPGMLAIIRRDVEVCMPDLDKKMHPRFADSQNPAGAESPIPPVLPRGLFDPHDGHPLQYHRITPTGADANWQVTHFTPR
jgi:hypothetical protein